MRELSIWSTGPLSFGWETSFGKSLMSRVSWGKALESRIQDQERQAVWDSFAHGTSWDIMGHHGTSWDLICSAVYMVDGHSFLMFFTCWPLEQNQKQMGCHWYHSTVVIRCRLHVAVHSMCQIQTPVVSKGQQAERAVHFSIVSSFCMGCKMSLMTTAKWNGESMLVVSHENSADSGLFSILFGRLGSTMMPATKASEQKACVQGSEFRSTVAWKPNDSIRLMNWIRWKLVDQHPHRCAVSYVLAQTWEDHRLCNTSSMIFSDLESLMILDDL